jgi:hypothetical protein
MLECAWLRKLGSVCYVDQYEYLEEFRKVDNNKKKKRVQEKFKEGDKYSSHK